MHRTLLLTIAFLASENAIAAASTQPDATIALHVVPHGDPDSVCVAPGDLSGVNQFTEGALGTGHDVYLLVVGGDPGPGIGGMLCGLEYTPWSGPATTGGIDVVSWSLCADSEMTASGPWGAWPAAGSGNTIQWDFAANCQQSLPAGAPSEGVVAVAGAFYVYAYGRDYITVAPHPQTPFSLGLAVLDCAANPTGVAEGATGFAGFSDDGRNVGGNPIQGDGLAWSELSSAVTDDVSLGSGMSVADYDGDGDFDILAGGSPSNLYRNEGDGVFVDVTPPAIEGDALISHGIFGDADGDGDLDLYLGSVFANKMLRNDGNDAFVDVTTFPLNNTKRAGGMAWLDYDGDGDLDIYLGNLTGDNQLYRNNGNFGFTEVTPGLLEDSRRAESTAWGDYDNDGDLDLYLANRSYTNFLYRNEGGGVFSDLTAHPHDFPDWALNASWGDYNNDGHLDLFVTTDRGQSNSLFRSEGNGLFVDVTSAPLADGLSGRTGAWGDYDNDGDLDLFLANVHSAAVLDSPVRLFRNDGAGVFVNVPEGPMDDPGGGNAAAWADFDNDGDLDMAVAGAFRDRVRVFKNRLDNGNHWLGVRLQGTASNGFGIGARITISAGGQTQIRDVTTTGGHYAQGTLEARFGLGPETEVDWIEVRWPSGIVQDTAGVVVDQVLTLTEEESTVGVGDVAFPVRRRLLASTPNPFHRSASLAFELSRPGPVHLAIYDLSGRMVRELVNGERGVGVHHVSWDGRDETGQLLGAGIYFQRLAGQGPVQSRKMIRLR